VAPERTSSKDKPLVHLGLFALTLLSCFVVFYQAYTDPQALAVERSVDAACFAGCALLILGAHEMGHYLMARHHQVDASLPYFLPFPLGFGTLGAVIRMRGAVPTRNALVDIGAAGPLAGLMVALPLLVAGTTLSRVAPVPVALEAGFPGSISAVGLFSELLRWALGRSSPEAVELHPYFGDNLLTLGVVRLVFGTLPPGTDLYAHPVFLAAWFGLLVTMFNLIPIGQLDAGHLTAAWLGERAQTVGKAAALGVLFLALFCSASWLVWFLITTRAIGFTHPPVSFPQEPLSPGRKVVCTVCFLALAVTLMPVPLGFA
jgi:membrane-associated protease RseP (regulator of RpoE activity)